MSMVGGRRDQLRELVEVIWLINVTNVKPAWIAIQTIGNDHALFVCLVIGALRTRHRHRI